jgi:DNA-binding transcriptional LysR family regulator
MSAPSLSERVRDLEDRLGVRLFNRTTRSVALTEAGTNLLDRVGPALATIGDAVANIGTFGATPVGTLRIKGPRPALQYRLVPLVMEFLAAYPGVRVEIVADEAFIDVVAAGFDAGVRYGESLDQDMIAVSLGGPQKFRVVGSPAYFEKCGRPSRPEDLTGRGCFAQIFPRGNRLQWTFEKDGREVSISPQGPVASTEASIQLDAARRGHGLAFLFAEHCEADLVAGTLESVLDDWCQPFPGPFLYFPERRLMPVGLRAFVDFVKRRRGHEPA